MRKRYLQKGTPMEFETKLAEQKLTLKPLSIETLQVNLGKLCNQACKHCHVDAGPKRTEMMTRESVDRCLEILAQYPQIVKLDITGGAPELNDHFCYFVIEAMNRGKHVMVRHNLTVTLDPHRTRTCSGFGQVLLHVTRTPYLVSALLPMCNQGFLR